MKINSNEVRVGIDMKNLKMRTKLIVLSVLISLMPILAISSLIFQSASKELEKSIQKSNVVFSTLTKSQLTAYFNERKGDGNVIANSDSVVRSLEQLSDVNISNSTKLSAVKELEEFLSVTQKEFGYTDIFVTDALGRVVYAVTLKDELEGADLSKRSYVQSSLGGKQTWSTLFYSDVVKRNIMTLSTPIYAHNGTGKPIGSINVLFDQDKINSIVNHSASILGDSGDAYLINETGTLLTETRLGEYKENAALKEKIQTAAVDYLAPEIKAGNDGYTNNTVYKDYLGNPVFGSLNVVKLGDEFVGLIIEVNESEAFAGITLLSKFVLLLVGITILLAFACMYLVSMSITRPLLAVTENAKEISKYNLTQNIDSKYLSRKDEIGVIANAVHEVTINLRSLLNNILSTSEQVAAASQELTATSEQSATAAEEIAQTINEIAVGAGNQAESAAEGDYKLNVLGDIVDLDKANLNSLTEASERVSSSIVNGLEIVETLEQKTKASGEAASVVFQSILKTNESSEKISEASSLIAAIAQQTNLLALNAAIEAARAGEHGMGFAVVADEIRKLAEQSTQSTKNIDEMVKCLIEDASMAVEKMSEAGVIVKDQAYSVEQTRVQFNEISKAMQDSERMITTLEESSKTLEVQKFQVQEVIQLLSAVAQENAASTQEASAAIEEQTASIEEISNASENLSELAMNLRILIEKFKL